MSQKGTESEPQLKESKKGRVTFSEVGYAM